MFPLQRRGNIEKEVLHSFFLSSSLGSTSSLRQLIMRQSSIHLLSHSFFSLCSRYIFICLCSLAVGWGVALNYQQANFCFFMNFIQHCFICCPSDSIVSEEAGIEPRTVATSAMAVRRSNHSRSHPLNYTTSKKNVVFFPCFVPIPYTQLWGGGGGIDWH
jgi:hypothetical protein